MKKIFYILMAALALVAVSCEKTTEGLTGITYYPVITLNGDYGVVYLGETYEDPGCVAIMNGEDVTSQVSVSSNVNPNRIGEYSVTYSVVNEQGFSATATRPVYVVAEDSIENIYFSVVHGKFDGGVVYVTDNGDGTYHVSDICGGYYSYYKYPGYDAYGYDFYAEADFTIAEDGTITQVGDALNWYFGDPNDPSTMENGVYDAETGGFYWDMCFSGARNFYVNLYAIVK